MCIIAVKERGVGFPSKETLSTCFNNNPDGAGYMYAENNAVHIRKGFMTFKAFWKDLKKTRARHGEDLPYIFHFRISTQAGVNQQCTHPFPLSKKMDDLKQLYIDSKIGIVHNGIIDLTTEYTWGKNKPTVSYSDTMRFITDYLALIIKDNTWNTKDNCLLIERLIGSSRMAIMDGKGNITYLGSGWNCDDAGILYSNHSWETVKPKATTTYTPFQYSPIVKPSIYLDKKDIEYWTDWAETQKELDNTDADSDAYYNWTEANYDTISKLYTFSPDGCPFSIYDDSTYCTDCKNKNYCWFNDEELNWYNTGGKN